MATTTDTATRTGPRAEAAPLLVFSSDDGIAAAPDLTQHPYINDTGTLAFRNYGAWS